MKSIPADIPKQAHALFGQHYNTITRDRNKLFLFSADQKIEHLNDDFYGTDIPEEAQDPRHLFEIASKGTIGAFATHLGLIARYAQDYSNINYVVKLNGKTNLITTEQRDPMSQQLWSVHDVLHFKQISNLPICGVGYTIYIGSEYETVMLTQAAQMIYQAHQAGLITILWIYPRGKHIKNNNHELLAGAAGIANSLGADFVKIHTPKDLTNLSIICQAAGNTQVICAGGPSINQKTFLHNVYEQTHTHGCAGVAVGRNIFQNTTEAAINMTHAIASIVYNDKTPEEAQQLL